MCKVSRSSFQQRKKSRLQEEKRLAEKKKANDELKELLRKISKKLGYVPGERGFKVFLWRDFGINVGRKLIRRLMNEMHIFASTPKKDAYKGMAKHDHPCTAPDNLVNQNFRIAPRNAQRYTCVYFVMPIPRKSLAGH